MIEGTEVWNLILSPLLAWLQEIFIYRFWIVYQSGAGLWWSLWVPSTSGYSLICCTKTKQGSQRASPEGSVDKECSLLTPFPGVCFGGCEVAQGTVSALSVLSVPYEQEQCWAHRMSQAPWGTCNFISIAPALPLKGATRARMCCCTWLDFKQIHELFVSGCKALHGINALGCTKLSMKAFISQIYTLAGKITVTYSTGLLTCRLDQNLAARSWKPV